MLDNHFRLQAHVLAELFNSNNLVLLLVEMVLDLLNKVSTIPVASACDYLNVFRINAQSIHYFNYSTSYTNHTDDILQIWK
ncbi:MAG: hypothetical protein NW218_00865 [Saprospiraceae bacterium]|nr:hypothetical protein [Saprospiraceae bacterium]